MTSSFSVVSRCRFDLSSTFIGSGVVAVAGFVLLDPLDHRSVGLAIVGSCAIVARDLVDRVRGKVGRRRSEVFVLARSRRVVPVVFVTLTSWLLTC